MQKSLNAIQRADIIREQIQILDNTEGVTEDMIDKANDLLLHAEEEEANYIAEMDYKLDQKARANGDLTNQDIEDMADYYEKGL